MANANGEGSIYKRMRNGRQAGYIGAVSYTDELGAAKRHMVYGKTRTDVRDKMKAVRTRLENGAAVKDSKRSVADWLAHWRATTLAASNRKASTKELYGNLSRRHLETEPFGEIRLDKLKPSDVEGLVLTLRAMTKPGKVTEAEPDPKPVRALSDATIRQIYTVLRAGLDGAVRDGLLAKNPAAAVKRPGVARREAKHVEAVDVNKLLLCAEGLRYRNVLVLIAGTGVRRGEALALHWSDVDLEARTLFVRGTLGRVGAELIITEPKTERSRRSVPLSAPLVAMLRRHRADQVAERLRAANVWEDHDLVFATERGTPVDPRNALRTVQLAAEKANMDGIGVHTLRHSAAVAWLEGGTHIKAVADLLGHSSIAITGDVYGHTSDDTARSAVDALADQFGILDL
ncbi:tyrosine-type recombinase/integrase [Mycolicibacterium diernhoferi]|uniref:Site-specific integrase n=1 Tax=Mycolicibacterium diernhoferi TaxID=1801 RepID=A0A1Q4H9F8_9MYCO|nr:site-specific integrase [Mycolicibacterium diernhoferi]OJZ64052.1 site-specific integrase [Mycolicibacterium diernhoferi]OPE54384.1 site-specific integrase [Mycolicibacterium diernhoferi]PEG55559.1 site-specific integrase [Mycolicibacterium diernhoferi]QYL20746.1 site-specific integrase [Mycolicibacterium diernhoferi]